MMKIFSERLFFRVNNQKFIVGKPNSKRVPRIPGAAILLKYF